MATDKETDQYQNSNLRQKKADLENLFTTDTTKESPFSLSLSQTCQLHEEIKLFDQFSGIDLGKSMPRNFLLCKKVDLMSTLIQCVRKLRRNAH